MPGASGDVAFVAIPGTDAVLELTSFSGVETHPASARPCDPAHGHVCLYVDDLDATYARLEALGYTCKQYSFSDSNDIAAVTQTAADQSDVLYLPTDNTVASNAGVIDNICRPAGIPVIAGEEGICAACGVATLSISYYDLGVATGKMAAQILTGKVDVAELPVGYAETVTPKYNETICTELGLTPPAGYEAIG